MGKWSTEEVARAVSDMQAGRTAVQKLVESRQAYVDALADEVLFWYPSDDGHGYQ
jgi:hypothetical protein